MSYFFDDDAGQGLPPVPPFLKGLLAGLALALLVSALASCETVGGRVARAVEESGFDREAPVRVEVGKYHVAAVRVFGLPVGVGVVYLGRMDSVDAPGPLVITELPPVVEVAK